MSIVYQRRGSGEPLVLLHGIGHHWRAWEPVLDRLSTVHDVIAVDLPGFGASPVPDGGMPAGMAGTVEAIAQFFAESGLSGPQRRPHVAGNSLGGAIALELAVAGLVASATALSPAGFWTPAQRRWALAVLQLHRAGAHLPAPVLRTVFHSGAGRALSFGTIVAKPGRLTVDRALADSVALRNGKGFRAVARAGRTYQFTGGAPTVPVTVAWGTRDRLLSYRQSVLARQRLPGARHVDLPGCGHVPMTDDPDLVASLILETTATRS